MSDNWQRLLDSHPQGQECDTPEFWETYLGEHPDVLHRLLADLYHATYGSERPPTLDDLWEMMAVPRFSTDPFGEACLDLLGPHSIRWLAHEIGTSHTQVSRYLNASRPIVNINDTKGSMRRIESVAKALHVHPSYFVEWRRLWVVSLIDAAFSAQPTLSVGVFRRFSGFEQKASS